MNARTRHDEQVVSQFTQQAEGYRKLTAAMPTDRTAQLRTLARVGAADVALDVACGPGSLALELAPHVRHVTGIDLTPAMLEQAQLMQDKAGARNVDWQLANACQLPFADAAFSLVFCRAAFHHLQQPRQVLSEMTRVCRAGGRVTVIDVTPAPECAAGYDAIELMRDPSHAHAHTLEELCALGTGLPLQAPLFTQSVTAQIPFDAVLATSHPERHTIEEVRAKVAADADGGQNRLGLNARIVNGQLCVSYTVSTVVWTRV
jgi:ubiquinone/menaquinone biosynthesis C-methylase UbiE